MQILRNATATLVFMLAVTAIQSTAQGQSPTTAPTPVQAPLSADPNRMADEALRLTDIGTKEAMEEAAGIVANLLKIAPQTPKLLLAYARLLAADGKGPQAIRYYELFKTTADGRDDYRPYAEMGRLYMRSKRPRSAKHLLEDAKKFAPEKDGKGKFIRAEISMDLANVLLQLEDRQEAVRVGREAATQAKDDAKIQILFSRLVLAVTPTETKEARDVAARAVAMLTKDLVEKDPFSIPTLQMLREALAVVENTWATEAGMQDKNPEPAHFLSIATQDVAEITHRLSLVAAREYELRAIELNGNKAEYKIRLAEIEAQMGATDAAGYTLDAVLKDDPENKEALALKERIATTPVRKIGAAAGL